MIEITEELIMEKVNELPNNLVSGPDGIPNIFIKRCIHTLIKPIAHMLNESLNTGLVPAIWKCSYVKPIHKNGPKNKIENYRGVALQCIIPKLLDSIVAGHINFHMKNVIDESQHGFVKGKSTTTNLIEFTSSTIEKMEHHIPTHAVEIDLVKAFDAISVELLLQKLETMGLNNQLLNWIKSYLNERKQIVKLKTTLSDPIEVTSGTGQGYPIGATLFLLFIIDLPRYVTSSRLQSLADDTRLWKHITCKNDCLEFQDDLNRIVEYFKRNNLKLNTDKTKFMLFHRTGETFEYDYYIDGEKIEKVKVIKDLGIILDEKMNFHAHIEYITAKAKSVLAWIKRFSRDFEDPWTIKKLFFTFILPIIEYGSQIWNPYTDQKIARIESIQKQFLLFALRKMNWPHKFKKPLYESRLLLLQMVTLEQRRKIAQVAFIHNVLNGHTSSKSTLDRIKMKAHSHRTRNPDFLLLPIGRPDYSEYEPINYMLKTYNEYYKLKVSNCDEYLIDFNASTNVIKQRLTEYFKSNVVNIRK